MIRFVLFLFLALGLAYEHSSFAQTPASALAGMMQFKTGYFDQDDNPIDSDSLPREALLRLSFIAGGLSGKVTNPPVSSITVRVGETGTLDLANIQAMAEQSATVLTPNALADGLVTAPKETRIARLATVVYQKPEKGLGRSTFRRIAAHESLILVYFDRPCYLSGAIHTRESEIAYDVNVDKAGLQWLKIVKKSSTRYAVSASKSPQEIFLRIVPWIGTAKADEGGPTIEPRLYVTPTTRKTFSPQKVTPAGTVFYVKVLKKADDNAIRLHRCGAPCNNAATVKIWEPESYKSGDELKWRVDKDGTYYLWIQDRKKNAAVVASSDELSGGKLRIVFASGASIETWYIAP